MAADFHVGEDVAWHGEPARVIEVRSDRVALLRLRDNLTILTTVAVLRDEQPFVMPGPHSLLGPVAS